jgi:4-hydroxybenzoate polyprenyltransferase
MTALTLELVSDDVASQFQYIILIGVATSALYCAHRVIGLHKLAHVTASERFQVIRRYKAHIWLYSFVWVGLSFWLFIPMANLNFIIWLIPGGSIALAYVLPFLSKGRRLRDLGWLKIVLIGWSWAWLTAFLPCYYFEHVSLPASILIGIERMLFIIAITVPFEIRDMAIDSSVGLMTMPSRFGMERTLKAGIIMCISVTVLAFINGVLFKDYAYPFAMLLTVGLTLWILKRSATENDDYFFSGLTDGTMIIALVIYWIVS